MGSLYTNDSDYFVFMLQPTIFINQNCTTNGTSTVISHSLCNKFLHNTEVALPSKDGGIWRIEDIHPNQDWIPYRRHINMPADLMTTSLDGRSDPFKWSNIYSIFRTRDVRFSAPNGLIFLFLCSIWWGRYCVRPCVFYTTDLNIIHINLNNHSIWIRSCVLFLASLELLTAAPALTAWLEYFETFIHLWNAQSVHTENNEYLSLWISDHALLCI